MDNDDRVRSVARAVGLLEQFTLQQPELTLAEITASAKLSKSTAHRLLSTLEDTGLVVLNKKTGRYGLGLKTFRLGCVVSETSTVMKHADPLLQRLAEENDEPSFLMVPDGDEALCARRFNRTRPWPMPLLVPGERVPFNCGSAQRVLLAHLPVAQWEDIIAGHVSSGTRYSLTTSDDLKRDREEIRNRGYCVAWEDVFLGVCAVGAPVYEASGTVTASISISGMVQRFSAERLPSLVGAIVETADQLSRELGYAV